MTLDQLANAPEIFETCAACGALAWTGDAVEVTDDYFTSFVCNDCVQEELRPDVTPRRAGEKAISRARGNTLLGCDKRYRREMKEKYAQNQILFNKQAT